MHTVTLFTYTFNIREIDLKTPAFMEDLEDYARAKAMREQKINA